VFDVSWLMGEFGGRALLLRTATGPRRVIAGQVV